MRNAEAAFRDIQLGRGHAKIEENTREQATIEPRLCMAGK